MDAKKGKKKIDARLSIRASMPSQGQTSLDPGEARTKPVAGCSLLLWWRLTGWIGTGLL
jgi:hypothetical protein